MENCILLNIKIQHIDKILKRRKEIAEKYLKELDGVVGLPNNTEGRVWQDFVITCGSNLTREKLYNFLKDNGVETMRNEYPFSPAYPKPPLAERFEAESLRIPCNENLEEDEVDFVILKIKEFYQVKKCPQGKDYCNHCGHCEGF